MPGLQIRKVADKSTGSRVPMWDPHTGEKKLVNPDTPGADHEAWPLAGVLLEQAPDEAGVSTTLVAQGIAEGWLTGVNGRPVVRPAGRTQSDWISGQTGTPHVFIHYDALVFHTLDGDVTYRVTHQPDKYADSGSVNARGQVITENEHDDDTPVTPDLYAAGETRVDWFYGIVKES